MLSDLMPNYLSAFISVRTEHIDKTMCKYEILPFNSGIHKVLTMTSRRTPRKDIEECPKPKIKQPEISVPAGSSAATNLLCNRKARLLLGISHVVQFEMVTSVSTIEDVI